MHVCVTQKTFSVFNQVIKNTSGSLGEQEMLYCGDKR